MLLPQVPVSLKYEQVLRYLGHGNQSFSGKPDRFITETITRGRALLHPAAVVADMYPHEQEVWPQRLLKCCLKASVVAVTVGETIEQETNRLFQIGETAAAVILDAVATAGVEAAADWVVHILAQQNRGRGLFATPRYGPGYGGLAMEYLPTLYELAGAQQIGITFNQFYQMTPVKTLLFVVGWSINKYDHRSNCDWCSKKDCQFRKIWEEGEDQGVL
ncbi:Vitamin B12 dependent methionine synthase activation region [Desulfotomaculum nigrificans]|uniref:Vitamin B12 dependent methionine synthase activation region n=1 Tax=Desulfotomaculum nigrificans TaxID=1565 RepID=UPI0001FAE672|nr:Vitamin B12 dependent methionine synthase activation region [Desulfotomaculum nigrificans]